MIDFTPYPYQQKAIDWIIDKPYCALFLDMGLGKTVSTLTAIQQLIDDFEVCKVLVVAPKKVAEATWTAEAEKWEHLQGLRVVKVLGTAAQRAKALKEDADVYVTGRDNLTWLYLHYKGKLPFDTLVLDELTSFKSSKSKRFKVVKASLPYLKRVIGLTGTPAPNGLIDLWAQMYCIDGGHRLGKSFTRFRETYFNYRVWNNIPIGIRPKSGSEDKIQNLISDICLSMQAKDYLSLPDKIIIDEYVDMGADAIAKYRTFEREMVLEVKDAYKNIADIPATSAAALMTKLSQYANGAIYDEERNVYDIHDAKLDRLEEIVECVNGSVLVFYQYKHDARRIMERLSKYKVRQYANEQDLCDWNAGEIDVLLAHPASTAFGLNMQQGGHYIVWFGTGWNLELYEQANARLHRQGQPHPVTIYNLLSRGTVDERMCVSLKGKHDVQQCLMDNLRALLKAQL